MKYNRAVLRSKLRTTAFVNELSIYLNELLAPTITIHGVLDRFVRRRSAARRPFQRR